MLVFSKRNLTKKYPKPSACIIEMIQLVLQVKILFQFLNRFFDLLSYRNFPKDDE